MEGSTGFDHRLDEARTFPEIFVGPALAHEKDAVEFAELAAATGLAVRLSMFEYAVRAYGRQARLRKRRPDGPPPCNASGGNAHACAAECRGCTGSARWRSVGQALERRCRVSVAVTVPVLTLLGGNEPGTLNGHGLIGTDTARKLAAHGPSFLRLLTHPVSGAVLELDRTVYRPPADLQRWVGVRDYQFDFPGCGRLAKHCDLDHLISRVAGGATSDSNLHALCRDHNRVKHRSKWAPKRTARGTGSWTGPTGYTREADPPPF